MGSIEFGIRFPGASAAQANRWADDLARMIEDTHRDARVALKRERDDTMDLGTVLGVVLGSAAVTAVAKGIQAWLAKNQDATLEITKDGGVKATGLRGKDVVGLAEILLKSPKL